MGGEDRDGDPMGDNCPGRAVGQLCACHLGRAESLLPESEGLGSDDGQSSCCTPTRTHTLQPGAHGTLDLAQSNMEERVCG